MSLHTQQHREEPPRESGKVATIKEIKNKSLEITESEKLASWMMSSARRRFDWNDVKFA